MAGPLKKGSFFAASLTVSKKRAGDAIKVRNKTHRIKSTEKVVIKKRDSVCKERDKK